MEAIFNELFNELGGFAILIIIFHVLIYIMPLFIYIDVKRLKEKNYQMENELNEIKNLLILQNEILRNRPQL